MKWSDGVQWRASEHREQGSSCRCQAHPRWDLIALQGESPGEPSLFCFALSKTETTQYGFWLVPQWKQFSHVLFLVGWASSPMVPVLQQEHCVWCQLFDDFGKQNIEIVHQINRQHEPQYLRKNFRKMGWKVAIFLVDYCSFITSLLLQPWIEVFCLIFISCWDLRHQPVLPIRGFLAPHKELLSPLRSIRTFSPFLCAQQMLMFPPLSLTIAMHHIQELLF